MSEEDNSLFRQAMLDVKPLKNKPDKVNLAANKEQPNSKVILKKVRNKRRQESMTQMTEMQKSQTIDAETVGAFEAIFYSQSGVRSQELSKLQKGQFHVEAELDLHGLTQPEAELEIDAFIALNYSRQARYLRIIHGKGYNSDDTKPILKNLTNQMLRQFSEVIAFTTAAAKDGGTGAVNILLKAR